MEISPTIVDTADPSCSQSLELTWRIHPTDDKVPYEFASKFVGDVEEISDFDEYVEYDKDNEWIFYVGKVLDIPDFDESLLHPKSKCFWVVSCHRLTGEYLDYEEFSGFTDTIAEAKVAVEKEAYQIVRGGWVPKAIESGPGAVYMPQPTPAPQQQYALVRKIFSFAHI